MNILGKINFVVVTLLGIAAGIPKIMRIPAEVSFFESVGLGSGWLVVFGVLQLAGGILMVIPKTRVWGASIVAVMFLASAVMLLLSGQITFGLVSMVPVLMAAVVIWDRSRLQATTLASHGPDDTSH